MPEEDANGNVPAVEYARASIAREVVTRRLAAGMTQQQLAAAARVRVETLRRIENARHTADVATLTKIDAALNAAPKKRNGSVGRRGGNAAGRVSPGMTIRANLAGSYRIVGQSGNVFQVVKVAARNVEGIGSRRKGWGSRGGPVCGASSGALPRSSAIRAEILVYPTSCPHSGQRVGVARRS